MELKQAVSVMVGRTDLCAVRPEGDVISVTKRSALKMLTPKGWKHCILTLGAVVADNWDVKPFEVLMREVRAERGEEM